MDFKELLSLAKDNQSFAMKKHQRDSTEKARAKKGGVSDSAVKSFLAKKKQMEEQRKAAEEAERRKRILARLDAVQGKRKTGKEKYNTNEVDKQRKLNMEAKSHEATHRMESLKSATDQQRKPHAQSTEPSDRFQIPKKKPTKGTGESTSNGQDFISTAGNDSRAAPSKESRVGMFKQYRRRKGKESDFEWSGSTPTMPNSNSARDKSRTIRKQTGKKLSSTPSFQELMSIAQQQKDRPVPVAVKNPFEGKSSGSKAPDSIESLSASEATVVGGCGGNSILKGQNMNDTDKGRKVSARDDIKDRISRQNRCSVTTHTINVKSNYDAMGNPITAQRGYGSKLRSVNGDNGIHGRAKMPNAPSKRHKVSSIDDELEQERIELERKRNLLRMKLKGGKGINDNYDLYENPNDYYDDMDDFIDDAGDEFDYSKHIRGIFGYDRRRYIDEDDDLRDMESNYRQIAAEEARSMRIARLEDEIERRNEEMEQRKGKRFKN